MRFTDPSGPTLRRPVLARLEDPSTGDDERDRPELLLAELKESSSTAPWCTSRRCTTAAFPPVVGSFAASHRAFSSATAFPSSSERGGAPGFAEALRAGHFLPLAFPLTGVRLPLVPAAEGMVWQEYKKQLRTRACLIDYTAPGPLFAKTAHTTFA